MLNKKIVFVFSSLSCMLIGANNLSNNNQNADAIFINKSLDVASLELTEDSYKRDDMYIFKHAFIKEDEMPILGFITPPGKGAAGTSAPSFLNRDVFQLYKDCGFNILVPCYDRTNFKEAEAREEIQLCNELEIVYIANDTRIRAAGSEGASGTVESYKAAIDEFWFTKEPCFGGVELKDEPCPGDFEQFGIANEAYLEKMGESTFLHSTLFPRGITYLNLKMPDYSLTTITDEEYKWYVTSYLDQFKPRVLAYDQYIWHVNSRGLNSENATSYFSSLSFYNKQSILRNIPFWPTIAVYRHANDSVYTDEETYWTVNTALAYGARGLQYYVYWPLMEAYDSKDYLNDVKRSGAVSGNGIPLDAYYRVQKTTEQAKYAGKILLNSKHQGIMQFGEYQNPVVEEDVLTKFGPLKNITGGDSFVGCYKHGDKYVYYIVNNNINDGSGSGILGDSVFKVDFDSKVKGCYSNIDQGERAFENTYSICFRLSPGEAMLLEV